tara:strand:- start:309 stop:926 length:618 start_codon:yes stop_codon:yes gene_type:complete
MFDYLGAAWGKISKTLRTLVVGFAFIAFDRISSVVVNLISEDQIQSVTLAAATSILEYLLLVWRWLLSDIPVPGIIVAILSFLSAFSVFIVYKYVRDGLADFDPYDFYNYTSDNYEGIHWAWDWVGNDVINMSDPMCPKCKGFLKYNAYGHSVSCLPCCETIPLPEGMSLDYLARNAEAEMARRVRNNEFVEILKKQRKAKIFWP